MQGKERRASIMHRSMIFICIPCLVLSLAPAIIAPPEREFPRGQPELHQVMDNMVTYRNIISKRINSDAELDHRDKLTSKTSKLLTETEDILSSLPATKERQWLESFVERMRALAIMLEKTDPQNKKQHLPEGLKSANLTHIQEALSIEPTWPTLPAVPETNSFQKSNRMMTSKSPVTSPEFSDVLPSNEYSTERHSVTKPVVLLNENDEDELANELNSLHPLFGPQNSKSQDQTPVVTNSPPQVSPQSQDEKVMNIEEERERLKSQLIKELAEFQRLGGEISSDLIHDLKIENKKTAGFTNSPKQRTDINSSEAQKNDEFEAEKKTNFKVENKKYSMQKFPNKNLEKDEPHETEKLFPQLNLSNTFHNNNNAYFNPNIHAFPNEMEKHFPYKSPQGKEIPYEANFQNVRHNFLKPKTYNNKEYYQSFLHATNKQPGHIPEAVRQMLSKPKNQVYDGYLSAHNYNEFLMKHGYGPYPYKHNLDHKISTHYPPSKMFSTQPKQPINHQMDAELSEDMKRQLRDGKIIVLSDSVVRSNFEPCKDNLDNVTKKENLPSENIEKKNDSKISK